jgi:hypothetical protein
MEDFQKMYRKNHPEIVSWLKKRHGFSAEAALEEVGHCYTEVVARCLSLKPAVCEDGLSISVLRNNVVVETRLYHKSQLIPVKSLTQKKPPVKCDVPDALSMRQQQFVTEEPPRDHGWVDSQ